MNTKKYITSLLLCSVSITGALIFPVFAQLFTVGVGLTAVYMTTEMFIEAEDNDEREDN